MTGGKGAVLPGALLLVLLSACGGGTGGRESSGADEWREQAAMEPELRVADSLVAAAVEAGTVPGAVFLVSRDRGVILERAYGFAQVMELRGGRETGEEGGNPYAEPPRLLRTPRPMTPGTAFDLASLTKVMATTMAVMLLVDRGEVVLEAPAFTYLPEFRDSHKDSITVRHLLTHSAGLAQWQPLYYGAKTREEAFRVIREMPLSWGVGEARHYSDLGFMLLGMMVERVAGRSLDRFLSESLYEPLGLERTGFRRPGCGGRCPAGPFAATSHGNPYEWRMAHDTSFGYLYPGDPEGWTGWRRYTLVGEVNDGNAFHAFGGVAGHAGLFSTAGDLQRLLQLLLNGGELGGRRYLKEETVAAFLEPALAGQALGWQIPPWASERSFSHTGFTGTFVMGIPTDGLAVVLLTNRQNLGVGADTRYPDLGGLQRAVVEALMGGGLGG